MFFPNGKRYVGQTSVPLKRRWGKNGRKYENQPYLYNAILKYGWNNIEHLTLKSNLIPDEADYFEKYYIKLYNSCDENFGYNIETGGSLHKEVSQKTRKKLSQINLGKKLSEETKKKMSISRMGANNSNYGVKYSEERKKQMSIARIGKPSANKGKKLSEERKKQMSISRKGKKSHAIWTDEMRKYMSIKQKELYNEEHRKKSSEIKKGGKNPMAKTCIITDLILNKEYIFESCTAAINFMKIGHATFTTCVNSNKIYKNRYIIKSYKHKENILNDKN